MAPAQVVELERINAQIVGHLLARRSPPRDLVARRESLRIALETRAWVAGADQDHRSEAQH